jgi:hypothetical protein
VNGGSDGRPRAGEPNRGEPRPAGGAGVSKRGATTRAGYWFPLGWYWVVALAGGSLLTAAWYRWQDRRHGTRTPLRGYLATGLVLAAVTAALPLLATAVGLGILARIGHSREMAVITAIYTATVCLSGWLNLEQAPTVPAFYPFGDPAVLLPAAVLLLAGLSAMLTTGLRQRRPRVPGAGITAKIAE